MKAASAAMGLTVPRAALHPWQEMQEDARPYHVLSFGGGVNSVALMVLLLDDGAPLDEVVFADTGAEVPETYEYVELARELLARRGIPLTVVRKGGGDLYETCQRRRVIPSAVWRWSTRDFKVRPIHTYYRSLKRPIVQYVAIAFDELERVKDSRVDYVQNVYPLVDRRISRQRCIEIIEGAGLPPAVKSGCFFCPFNTLPRWEWLASAHPDLFAKAVELEEGSKHFPNQRLTDQTYRRNDVVLLRDLPRRASFDLLATPEIPCGGECMT
jgi:hypothetical protein